MIGPEEIQPFREIA
jgi:hypothetical protein